MIARPRGAHRRCGGLGRAAPSARHEHVPKKLLDFFDSDMLRLFDFERVLFDHVIPRDRDALIELANRESRSSWKDFLLALKRRGLSGVEYAVFGDHPGLKAALREVLPEAAWQRCYVHFLRNALDYVPRKGDDDCSRSCAGCTIAAILPILQVRYPGLAYNGQMRSRPVARKVAGQIRQALRLGRGQYRRDADLLPAAAGAPQARRAPTCSNV